MRRYLLLFTSMLVIFGIISTAYAQDEQTVCIQLLYPRKSTAPISANRVSTKPDEVNGVITLTIDKKPKIEDVENDVFLVQYYFDDDLFYETNGENINDAQKPSFDCQLDTTRYTNGAHQITVNLWDAQGPSAIGIKNIIINNESER